MTASMIIDTESLYRHVREMSCMEEIVETTGDTVLILGRNESIIDGDEVALEKPKPAGDKNTNAAQEAFSLISIRAAQTIRFTPISQVHVFCTFQASRSCPHEAQACRLRQSSASPHKRNT